MRDNNVVILVVLVAIAASTEQIKLADCITAEWLWVNIHNMIPVTQLSSGRSQTNYQLRTASSVAPIHSCKYGKH